MYKNLMFCFAYMTTCMYMIGINRFINCEYIWRETRKLLFKKETILPIFVETGFDGYLGPILTYERISSTYKISFWSLKFNRRLLWQSPCFNVWCLGNIHSQKGGRSRVERISDYKTLAPGANIFGNKRSAFL